jgi:hypothetical protein
LLASWPKVTLGWKAFTKRAPVLAGFPAPLIRFLGTCELFAVVGLVVPSVILQALGGAGLPAALTTYLPWVAIAVALSCCVSVVGAIVVHSRRREVAYVAMTLVLLLLRGLWCRGAGCSPRCEPTPRVAHGLPREPRRASNGA